MTEGVSSAVKDWMVYALNLIATHFVTAALPFSVVIIFMMIGLVKSLRTQEEVGPQYVGPGVPVHGAHDEAGPGQ